MTKTAAQVIQLEHPAAALSIVSTPAEHDPIIASGADRRILSAKALGQTIGSMAKSIITTVGDAQELCFVGIQTRGVPLARRIMAACAALTKQTYQFGMLDINLYRDDLSEVDQHPVVRRTELPGHMTGRGVVLVDDVLFTGRTIRAALDALVDFGRPKFVHLAVLIDRGYRELPIHADVVGKVVETTRSDNVKVCLEETDGHDEVLVVR